MRKANRVTSSCTATRFSDTADVTQPMLNVVSASTSAPPLLEVNVTPAILAPPAGVWTITPSDDVFVGEDGPLLIFCAGVVVSGEDALLQC